MTTRKAVLGGAAGAVLLAGLWYAVAGHRVPIGQPPLADLTPSTIHALQDDFNQSADQTRVVLLLAPT